MRYIWVGIVTGDYMCICIGIRNDTRFAGGQEFMKNPSVNAGTFMT